MGRLVRIATCGLAAVLGLAAGAPLARATVMVPLTIEDMSVRSAAVVRGRVLGSNSAWDEGHQRIYTYTEIKVLDPIHASSAALPPSVVVRTLGGEVGDIGMKVSGTARFASGEEVLLFLRADPLEAGKFQVVGMSQGKWQIKRENKGRVLAVPSVEGLAFVKPDGSGTLKVDPSLPRPDAIPLDEMRKRILTAIATGGVTPAAPAQPATPTGPAVVPSSPAVGTAPTK